MAQRNAVQVIQAQGQVRTSGAAVKGAYAAFLPNVSLSAGATRQYTSGGRTRVENGQVITLPSDPWSSSAGLGANVDLFTGGQRFFDLSRYDNGTGSMAATLNAYVSVEKNRTGFYRVNNTAVFTQGVNEYFAIPQVEIDAENATGTIYLKQNPGYN